MSPFTNCTRPHGALSTLRRHWNCPSEKVMAAYLDGGLSSHARGRIDSHLSKCAFCCQVVADVVKLQTNSLPAVRAGLVQQALSLTPAPRRRGWILVPVAGVVLVVLAGLIAAIGTNQKQLALFSPPTLPGPAVTKVHSARLSPQTGDVNRKRPAPALLPDVTAPRNNSTVRSARLQFDWKPVPSCRYYDLHLTTSEGGLIWQHTSENATLRLPASVTLSKGEYFVWVTAHLSDGGISKSAPIAFRVPDSR